MAFRKSSPNTTKITSIRAFLILITGFVSLTFTATYGLEGTTAYYNPHNAFTLNYPGSWSYEEGACYEVGYRCIIVFLDENQLGYMELEKFPYPELSNTPDRLYLFLDHKEELNESMSVKSKELFKKLDNNVFSIYALSKYLSILSLTEQGSDVWIKSVRMFETDGGLPAHQIEYDYTVKFQDNTTEAFSSLSTTYFLETLLLQLHVDSPIEDYASNKPFFIESANSFDILSNSLETRLSETTKKRLLDDMKAFPNTQLINILKKTDKYGLSSFSIKYENPDTKDVKTTNVIKNPSRVNAKSSGSGGCLIATAAYDSEMSQQVQSLRDIRDNTILQTEYGSAFLEQFHQVYYLFSPTIANWERQNPIFKEIVKIIITPLLISLSFLEYLDIDSEYDILVYGIGIMSINVVVYFIAPILLIYKCIRSVKNRSKIAIIH